MIKKFFISHNAITLLFCWCWMMCISFDLGAADMHQVIKAPSNEEKNKSHNPEISHEIIVIINHDAITKLDIVERAKFIVNTTNINEPHGDEMIKALHVKALQSIIDTKLIFIAAKKLGIKIDDSRMLEVMNNIAQQYNIEYRYLSEKLNTMGIDFNILKQQLLYNLILSDLIDEYIVPQINISDIEINEYGAFKDIDTQNTEKQFKLHEILLHFDESNKMKKLELANYIKLELDKGASLKKSQRNSLLVHLQK